MKILLVEDHAPTADRLSALLTRSAHIQVMLAGSLAEGLQKSAEFCPDITLLDLVLPDSPDWQGTLDAIPKFKPPVIVVSELVDPEIRVAAIKAGAVDAFKKRTVLSAASILISAAASARIRRINSEATING